jgi:hypothetical protein
MQPIALYGPSSGSEPTVVSCFPTSLLSGSSRPDAFLVFLQNLAICTVFPQLKQIIFEFVRITKLVPIYTESSGQLQFKPGISQIQGRYDIALL